MTGTAPVGRSSRLLLSLAAVAVAFAAADTYVVVLALPDMMSSADLTIDQLQRGAPIVSGFLLGYIGILPLIGRIADLRGRLPVLVWSLAVFALGSVVTAAAYDLDSMVVGRFLQGAGGGGLVPATLALVADLWPAERRGLPLGVVGAVQELGSVLGPLLGALVLAVADWRAIFWVNTAVGLVLAAAILACRSAGPGTEPPVQARGRGRPDALGALLVLVAVVVLAVILREPRPLVTDVTYGLAFLPVAGDTRWLSPLALAWYGLLALFVLRQATARRPLLDWRSWPTTARLTDIPGASLLALALAGIIFAFASADPEVQVFSRWGPYLLAASALAAALFGWRQARARHPLVPRGALAARPAWGAIVVSFAVGTALVAALVDIPFFARLTAYPDSQLDAALVARSPSQVHGVVSALLVVARMVGMLVGISALTTIGLRRFYAVADRIPPIEQLCDGSRVRCDAYDDALLGAGLAQLEAIFVGAGACALVAAVLALVTLRESGASMVPADAPAAFP